MMLIEIEETVEHPAGRVQKLHYVEWHIGEPLPERVISGRPIKISVDFDELNLVTRAMEISAGSNEWISYGKFQGFQSRLNERIHKAAYAVYRRVFWNLDTTEPSQNLWEELREALGIAKDTFLPSRSTSQIKWLIEYRTARPVPVYASTDTHLTVDPKQARQFDTREQCQEFMLARGYGSPWHATEHMFVGR